MKVLNFNSFYLNKTRYFANETNNNFYATNTIPKDTVSFTAKKYDEESIINPTNHCAYCGCKVYSEFQIESIAKEILSAKYDRMQGKIKSILEKLEGAKSSEELALAKRLENEDEIKFFRSLLDASSKKSYLKGDALFAQVYELNHDEAIDTLKMNLRPLLRTIDHVSPQNEGKDNNNADINLVESCWCCNHDLKKGAPFIEFYTMYPSIKNNMPQEKFQYAASSLLDFQSNGIIQRLSATNLLKTIKRLFIQRQEAQTYLDSIDFRIKTSISAIRDAIETSSQELADKRAELLQKENQLEQLKKDDEFTAILDRIALSKNLEAQNNVILQLKSKLQALSNQINELRDNPKKKSAKTSRDQKRDDLTPEQKKERIDSLKEQIKYIEEQILEQEIAKDDIETKIKQLDSQFPTVQEMQHEKRQADLIVNAHLQMVRVSDELSSKQAEFDSLLAAKKELEQSLSQLPETFDKPEIYVEGVQAAYNRYLQLVEAITYIDEHPNGGNINMLIKQAARIPMQNEIKELSSNPLVIQYLQQQERLSLDGEISSIDKKLNSLKSSINSLQAEKSRLEKTASLMSQDEASAISAELYNKIKSTNEKEQYTKLPQVIDAIKSEIVLINQTISDLQSRLSEIESQS